jgi:hypothetical protein
MAKATKAVTKKEANVPDYIKQGQARGSENVEMDDLVIPRIELTQDLSPCIKKNKPDYIEGAEAGMLYNNVTRELYKKSVTFVPVIFKKEYLIWKDRKDGGGFKGSFDTKEAAEAEIDNIIKTETGHFEAVDTAQHIVLVVQDDKVQEAVISMSRSKLKVSRNFNSLIRITGGDRFSRAYAMTAVEDSSDLGDYWNFKITPDGFPSEAVYKQAEKLYEDISSGLINATVDDNYTEEGATAGKSNTPF